MELKFKKRNKKQAWSIIGRCALHNSQTCGYAQLQVGESTDRGDNHDSRRCFEAEKSKFILGKCLMEKGTLTGKVKWWTLPSL